MNEESPRNENGIAGKPLYPTASADGHVFDSLQASNTETPQRERPNPQDSINKLHKVEAIPRIRTFESDIAEAIKNGQASVVKVAVAEEKKKEEVKKALPAQPQLVYAKPEKTHYLLFTLLFILIGTAIAGTIYYFIQKEPQQSPFIELPPSQVVSTEASRTIALQIDEDIRIHPDSGGEALENTLMSFVFTQRNTPEDILLDAQGFMNVLDTQAPDFFIRTLQPRYSVGLHYDINSHHPYIVFKTSSYDNAYAGMLTWEQTMYQDFKEPFALEAEPVAHFQDEIIHSKDVRMLTDSAGIPIILYSFVDNETIIITTHSETVNELLKRLSSS